MFQQSQVILGFPEVGWHSDVSESQSGSLQCRHVDLYC